MTAYENVDGDPRIMCRQHLLGEHVEIHMVIGPLNRGKTVDWQYSSK